MCGPVEGLFLDAPDLSALRASAEQARLARADVLFLTDGPLGDAIALAAGLAATVPDVLFGVRTALGAQPHRHPTILARDMTTLDLVTGGRALLAFMRPFTAAVGEAISLCRNMWREGIAVSEGPHFPVVGAINRPLPMRPTGPPIALDLTDGAVPEDALLAACDLVLWPADAATPGWLPAAVEVCRVRRARGDAGD
jgi:alkanesulfonate monooxygenase SsuD/methylene tetrahydromethanopterin reductase-like flavin-dependent oxidoreductase (luciferase family)